MTPEEHAALDHAIEDLKKYIRLLAGRRKDTELKSISTALLPTMRKLNTDNARRFVRTFGGAK